MSPLKVFVNFRKDESYFFTFPREIRIEKIKNIMEKDYNTAIQFLMKKSKKKFFIFPKDRRKAELLADFTFADGYSAERLA